MKPPRNLSLPLRAFAQHEFLDFAGRGFRQRAEDDLPRHLEMRQVLAAEGDDLADMAAADIAFGQAWC